MAVTRLGAGAGGTGTTSATWTGFNITSSDANTITVVLVNASSTATTTCSVTYGGTAMKQLGYVSSGAGFAGVGIYYLFNPGTGAKTIVATPVGGTVAQTRGIDVAFSGVSSISDARNVATMAHTVNSCANGYVLRVLSNGVTTGTLNQTTELAAGASVTGVGDFIAVQSAAGAAPSVAFTASGTATTPLSMGCNLTPTGAMNMVQVVAPTATSSGTSKTVVLPGPTRVGNTIIMCARSNPGSNTITSVADTAGNTYSVACPFNQNTAGGQVIWVYYALVTSASNAGANTITVTWSSSQTSCGVYGVEYDGLDPTAPFDQHKEGGGLSGTAYNSGNTPTTTVADELVFGFGTTVSDTTAAGAGFTGRLVGTAGGDPQVGGLVEDKVVSATGVQAATGTLSSSSSWCMSVATFKKATATVVSPGNFFVMF